MTRENQHFSNYLIFPATTKVPDTILIRKKKKKRGKHRGMLEVLMSCALENHKGTSLGNVCGFFSGEVKPDVCLFVNECALIYVEAEGICIHAS